MARERKVRVDRVIILILATLFAGFLFAFGAYKVTELLMNNKADNKDKPVTVVSGEDVKISLNDYTIYFDENNDLGFSFIIADIKFTSNDPISFDLGSLQTSEKIYLNDVSKYLNKLDLAGYNLQKLEISSNGVVSQDNSTDRKVFVPYNTDAASLTIYNLVNTSNSLNIDLSKEKVLATTLKLENKDNEILVGNTSIYVSKAYISDFMLHNGEPYEISSTSRMYSFEISVEEEKDKLKISEAIFIKNGTDEKIYCKAKDYKSIDMNNILDTDLSSGIKGGLFFEVYSNKNTVEDGVLLIKFSNQDQWIEISTKTE